MQKPKKKLMVLKSVAYAKTQKWGLLDAYIQLLRAGSISFTLAIASILCWQNDQKELAVGAGLSSATIYAGGITDNRFRAASGRYEREKEDARTTRECSLDALVNLCEEALEAREQEEDFNSRYSHNGLDEIHRKHKHPAVLYTKSLFFGADTIYDKDAYLWILLKFSNYQLIANPPTQLTYSDRMEAINYLLKIRQFFSVEEAGKAYDWAMNLDAHTLVRVSSDLPTGYLDMLVAALTASYSDLARQEAIFRIAIAAGIHMPGRSHPPDLQIEDCLEVLAWLKSENLLSLAQRQELENWVYSERELA